MSRLKLETRNAIKEAVSVWDELIASVPKERPEGSKTAEEFAREAGCGLETARRKLVGNVRLRAVDYLENGKRGKCYVVAE